MKKLLLYGLSLSLVFSLAACASKSAPSDADAATDAVQTDQSQDNEADDLTQAISNVQQSDDANTKSDQSLFYPDDRTLYAVETANLHEHYSEDSKIVGSLAAGDSIHCIGVGIEGDAIGWRKIQLSDGGIVYVLSDYIIASKPDTSIYNSTTSDGSTDNNPNGGSGNTSSGSSKADSEAEVPSQGSTSSGWKSLDDWINNGGGAALVAHSDEGNVNTSGSADPSEWEAGVKGKYDIYG